MTYLDVFNAIAEVLALGFPGETVYRNVCPQNFERPSFFLALQRAEPAEVNAGTIKWTVKLLLTVFDLKDPYYETNQQRLMDRQLKVLSIFSSFRVKVAGRSVQIAAAAAGRDPGEAYVEFVCEFVAPREVPTEPAVEIAETVEARLDVGLERVEIPSFHDQVRGLKFLRGLDTGERG